MIVARGGTTAIAACTTSATVVDTAAVDVAPTAVRPVCRFGRYQYDWCNFGSCQYSRCHHGRCHHGRCHHGRCLHECGAMRGTPCKARRRGVWLLCSALFLARTIGAVAPPHLGDKTPLFVSML
uniref:Uncharacterized protein n=1 Tax=Ixodes ricinus TaxID=34613 RepID=A0A6B0UPI3_IXORI